MESGNRELIDCTYADRKRRSGGFSKSAPLGQVYLCRPGNFYFDSFACKLVNFRPLSWTEESDDLFLLFRSGVVRHCASRVGPRKMPPLSVVTCSWTEDRRL